MLYLRRKKDETVVIDDGIYVTVHDFNRDTARCVLQVADASSITLHVLDPGDALHLGYKDVRIVFVGLVVDKHGPHLNLGFDAPGEVVIDREENCTPPAENRLH